MVLISTLWTLEDEIKKICNNINIQKINRSYIRKYALIWYGTFEKLKAKEILSDLDFFQIQYWALSFALPR